MRATRRATRSVLFALVPCLWLIGCGNGEARSEADYCQAVTEHLAELNSPAIATASDIGVVLEAWLSIADAAPVAIEPEWATMIDVIETAVTVDPDDPGSMQRVADTARTAEPAADRVVSYTQERCGITIGLSP